MTDGPPDAFLPGVRRLLSTAIVLLVPAGALAQLPNENLPGNSSSLPNSNLPGSMPNNNPVTLPNTDTTPSVIQFGSQQQIFDPETNLPTRNPTSPPTPEEQAAAQQAEKGRSEELERARTEAQQARDDAVAAREESAKAREDAAAARDEAAQLRKRLDEITAPTQPGAAPGTTPAPGTAAPAMTTAPSQPAVPTVPVPAPVPTASPAPPVSN
jgi:hypothetical protein